MAFGCISWKEISHFVNPYIVCTSAINFSIVTFAFYNSRDTLDCHVKIKEIFLALLVLLCCGLYRL